MKKNVKFDEEKSTPVKDLNFEHKNNSSENFESENAKAPDDEHLTCSGVLKIKSAMTCNQENKMFDEINCSCVETNLSWKSPKIIKDDDFDAILDFEEALKVCSGKIKIQAAKNCININGMLDEETCQCLTQQQ